MTEQARLNQLQDEERHREFLAQEGQFVLRQKRKAAEIRVREKRARPIDWLTANLKIIDPITDLINDDIEKDDPDYTDPEGIIEGLSASDLSKLCNDIDEFVDLERNPVSRDYWRTLLTLCRTRQQGIERRAVRSVSTDIDNLLGPKTFEELQKLEKQINRKLDSEEPVDTDYWQQLLDHLSAYKAKAKLKKLYQKVLDNKLSNLRKENRDLAEKTKARLSQAKTPAVQYANAIDPEPLLSLNVADRSLPIIEEANFLANIIKERQRVLKAGYSSAVSGVLGAHVRPTAHGVVPDKDDGVTASSNFDREVAKGVEEDEEVFAGEEQIESKNIDSWKGQYRPRKPRYFNRVQLGYEWNKYNQTHYDHDNPPPKVVQGYKFHIFYPDLIDPTKAPTYRIIREGGRKKGERVAPAGEEDTCIIRFMSGPPYEDVAFRIVDRDWDYSARNDRGFKSTFENGILTLHFSFKKVYYRK